MKKSKSSKRNTSNIYKHIRCVRWIVVAIVVSLALSLIVQNDPWKTIITNIFAGLFTGLVIVIISSLKSQSIIDKEYELDIYEMLYEKRAIISHLYKQYKKNRESNDDEYEQSVYDLACSLSSIEEYIDNKDRNSLAVRILGEPLSEKLRNKLNYDYYEQQQKHDELMNHIIDNDTFDSNERKTIDIIIKSILSVDLKLFGIIYNMTGNIKEEKIQIERAVP